jgi:hypothetical protein
LPIKFYLIDGHNTHSMANDRFGIFLRGDFDTLSNDDIKIRISLLTHLGWFTLTKKPIWEINVTKVSCVHLNLSSKLALKSRL